MFELTQEEKTNLRRQIGTSSWGGDRYPPMAFTEQGVAMLSSVLRSESAILVNIQIIRVFTRLKEILLAHKDIVDKLGLHSKKLDDQDEKINIIFEYLKQLEQSKQEATEFNERKRVGFRRSDET